MNKTDYLTKVFDVNNFHPTVEDLQKVAWDTLEKPNDSFLQSMKDNSDWVIYFDMDGVLAKWNTNAPPEQITSEGYFRNLEPNQGMVDFAKDLQFRGYDVRILSKSYYSAIQEKIDWLNEYLPSISPDKFVFVPMNANKSDFVREDEKSVLIDDWNDNLRNWKGLAVKCITEVNNCNKEFDSVYNRKLPCENYRSLHSYMNHFEREFVEEKDQEERA